MKLPLQVVVLTGYFAAVVVASLNAQLQAEPPTRVRFEASQLIVEDAAKLFSSQKAVSAEVVSQSVEDTVELSPFMVTESPLPDLTPPRETKLETFFRTGTLAERVGKTFTTRLWAKGDKGLMLSISR